MERKIPFRKDFGPAMRAGIKTKTSRSTKAGEEGDTFQAFNMTFTITDVRQETLNNIAQNHWEAEGVTSPDHFKVVWANLHRRNGFQAGRVVWLHTFERMQI